VKVLVLSALDQADVVGLHTSASFADEHKELGDLRDALPALLAERRRVRLV
jgi:hypothetical protein